MNHVAGEVFEARGMIIILDPEVRKFLSDVLNRLLSLNAIICFQPSWFYSWLPILLVHFVDTDQLIFLMEILTASGYTFRISLKFGRNHVEVSAQVL